MIIFEYTKKHKSMKYYKQLHKDNSILCVNKVFENGNGISVYPGGETLSIFNLDKYVKTHIHESKHIEISLIEFVKLRKQFINK